MADVLDAPTGQCAICEAELATGASHCITCGFPTDLGEDASRLIAASPETEADALARRRDDGTDAAAHDRDQNPSPAARDPQVEVANRIARDVGLALTLVHNLGGDGAEISSELAQAALTQAEGRIGEVLVLLRDAQGRVGARLFEQFERRVRQLEQRQAALVTSGVGINLGPELDRIRTELKSGRREEALRRIEATDRTLSQMESDWRGLQGLIRQIDNLREAARLLDLDVGESEDAVRQVRVILGRPSLDVSVLDHAAELAAEALMQLHDSIPLALQESLEQLAVELAAWPSYREGKAKALSLHTEAARHLRSNRLYDATLRTHELREMMAQVRSQRPPMEVVPEPTPEPSPSRQPLAPAPPQPAPLSFLGRIPGPAPDPPALRAATGGEIAPTPLRTDPATRAGVEPRRSLGPAARLESRDPIRPPAGVRSIVSSARELAARIRLLPPDSELARAAAAEIRTATELLRAQKMDEADRTLAELKNRLDNVLSGGI